MYNLMTSKKNGNTHHAPGLFDQCLAVRSQRDDKGDNFRGQYCSVFFDIEELSAKGSSSPTGYRESQQHDDDDEVDEIVAPKERSVRRPVHSHESTSDAGVVGFCIPSSCSARDLRSAVAQLLGTRTIGTSSPASVVTITDQDHCYSQDDANNKALFKLGIPALLTMYISDPFLSLSYCEFIN